jgi:diguanylate cyclase (GGDEF)-like protein
MLSPHKRGGLSAPSTRTSPQHLGMAWLASGRSIPPESPRWPEDSRGRSPREELRVGDGRHRDLMDRPLWESEQVEDPIPLISRRKRASAPRRAPLLVVNDDPEFCDYICVQGRTVGPVLSANTAWEALQIAEQYACIGFLLDTVVQGEPSFALARRLRGTALNRDTPIAFVSADLRLSTRIAASKAGGVRYLEKPLSPFSLTALLQDFEVIRRPAPAKVLVVGRRSARLLRIEQALQAAGMDVVPIPSVEALDATFHETQPDLLLLDHQLPEVPGAELCRALRQSDRWETLPILLLSDPTPGGSPLSAFQAGATDVIDERIPPEELVARVQTAVENLRVHRARSDTDALSGLLQRRALLVGLHRAYAVARRTETPLCVALIDIDNFKAVNDTYGHATGDRVIARLGALLRCRFRTEDLRGRWGGEEFIVVFPNTTPTFVHRAMAKLLEEFEAMPFRATNGHPFRVSFTAGIACHPGHATSPEELILEADRLLYQGKTEGRRRVLLNLEDERRH